MRWLFVVAVVVVEVEEVAVARLCPRDFRVCSSPGGGRHRRQCRLVSVWGPERVILMDRMVAAAAFSAERSGAELGPAEKTTDKKK